MFSEIVFLFKSQKYEQAVALLRLGFPMGAGDYPLPEPHATTRWLILQ